MSNLTENPKPRILHSQKNRNRSSNRVVVGPASPAAASPPAPAAATSNHSTVEATAKLVRSPEGIDTIEVTCACGQQIVLRCDYS
jgi:hypothetical protein